MRNTEVKQHIQQAFDRLAPELPGVSVPPRTTRGASAPARRTNRPGLRWAMAAAAAVLVIFCGFAVLHGWVTRPSAGSLAAATQLSAATPTPVLVPAMVTTIPTTIPTAMPTAVPTAVPTAAAAPLGQEQVQQIVLRHAGVLAEALQRWHTKTDRENGRMVYEVEFTAGDYEYDYEIDAITGEVLQSEWKKVQPAVPVISQPTQTPAPVSAAVTDAPAASAGDTEQEKALAIALEQAGVRADQAQRVRVEKDRDDGRMVYEVDFVYNGIEYEYEVDVATGEIRKIEQEKNQPRAKATAKPTAKPTAKATAKTTAKATAKATAKPTAKPTKASSTEDIGRNKALSIALGNAGVSSGDAKRVKVEKDRENGRMVYEVEFDANGYEYDYEIDAATGKILKKEKERDDD